MAGESKESKGRYWALLTTAIAALLTLVTGVVTSSINNAAQLKLETRKFESSLILKAIETGDRKTAADMLTFLVHTGLISDPGGRLSNLAREGNLPLLGRGGVPYNAQFIEETFSKFKGKDDLDPEFRAILVDLADNMVNHRWHRVATFFETDYYIRQVTLLSGERDIFEVFRQYIREAFRVPNDAPYTTSQMAAIPEASRGRLQLDKVVSMQYLEAVDGSRYGDRESIIVSFVLKQSDGVVRIGGFEFLRDGYAIVGADG